MADFTVKEWMDTQDALQQETIALDMAGSIDLGVIMVSDFLQELQPYLKADATLIESGNGMQLLSMVITRLQVDISRIELHSLVEYLCTRLGSTETIPNNRAGIKDTALSLQALANMTGKCPPGDASVIAQAVFSLPSSTLRDQKAAGRLALLELLNSLVQNYSPAIARDMGTQTFVDELVSVAEFEKDPSCLRILFQMYEQISQTWNLDSGSFKNIWDSYSRYFPITLSGAARDPSLPSPEELKMLLRYCFTSHDDYAEEAIPRLIDMLDTTQDVVTANVKNDVLETLAACISHYSLPIVSEWYPKIWDALKFEIWDGTNDEFIQRTLNILQIMTQKLDSATLNWNNLDTPFAKYVISASNECCERLHDSKQQHVLGSGQILHAIASGSHFAFVLVVRNILPKMFVIWQDLSSKEKKTLLLAVFNKILQASLHLRATVAITLSNPILDPGLFQYLQTCENTMATCLSTFQQRLVDDVYFSAMTEKDSGEAGVDTPFRANTIQGLVHLMRLPTFLFDFEKGTIIESLNRLALDSSQKEGIHSEAVSALQQISVEDPARFRDITVLSFMGQLPEHVSSDRGQAMGEVNNALFILEALLQISCTATCKVECPPGKATSNFKHRVFDQFQTSLLEKLFSVLLLRDQLPYANAILATMYRGLEIFDQVLAAEKAAGHFISEPDESRGPYTWIPMELYQKFIEQKQHKDDGHPQAGLWHIGFSIILDLDEKVNDMFIRLMGRITTLALRSGQTTPLNNFLFNLEHSDRPSQIWTLFCLEDPKDAIDISQQNLQYGPAEKCLTVVLSTSLLAGIRPEEKERLKIHIGDAAIAMIKNATSVANNECSPNARVSMLHFLQLLINKFGATKEKSNSEDCTVLQFMTQLAESCSTKTDDLELERIYQTLAYFTAASLAAMDRSDKTLIEHMILGIKHSRVGRKVAQSFRILLAPSQVMNEQNFCVLRKIRKQRLYQFTVDTIIGMWRESKEEDAKGNCLIALAGIFAHMENNILEENAATIFPIILEGTNVQNDDFTKLTYIQLIRSLIPTSSSVVLSHLDSVINRMTHQTHNTDKSPSNASVNCRATALDVLALLVMHVEKRDLLKRKAKIMVELDIASNDRSRIVRQSAERCKMRWFNLLENEN